jgi:hypothetical protein
MALIARVSLLAVLSLVLAAPAAAGPPGTWSRVTNADSNTQEVGVARTADGVLHVLWTQGKSVVSSELSADAKSVSGPSTVFTYPTEPNSGVSLLAGPAGLRAFFSGLYPDNPLDGVMATATSTDGNTWTAQATPASDGRVGQRSAVYAATGIGGTIAKNGVPISIWGDSGPRGYHVGLDADDPDVRFGSGFANVGGPNAATDSVTGEIAIAWHDLDADRTYAQFIAPAGGLLSTKNGRAPDNLERVAMTGRIGAAGIFVAYLSGDNIFTSRPAVWRLGAPAAIVLGPKDARYPGVSAAQGGRLWVFWAARPAGDWRVFARRSNKAATEWGATVSVKAPGGSDSLYSLEGDGSTSGGGLDVLALVDRGPLGNWHQRIRPGLKIGAKAIGDGKVEFTIRDAGDPVDAEIEFGGKTKSTGPDGEITMSADPGRRTARANAPGYHPAKRRVKVKQ